MVNVDGCLFLGQQQAALFITPPSVGLASRNDFRIYWLEHNLNFFPKSKNSYIILRFLGLGLSAKMSKNYSTRILGVRGLIHNAHLRKFLSFCKILDFKITYLKCIFNLCFDFMSANAIKVWQQWVKIVILNIKIECILQEKISKTWIKCVSELCE